VLKAVTLDVKRTRVVSHLRRPSAVPNRPQPHQTHQNPPNPPNHRKPSLARFRTGITAMISSHREGDQNGTALDYRRRAVPVPAAPVHSKSHREDIEKSTSCGFVRHPSPADTREAANIPRDQQPVSTHTEFRILPAPARIRRPSVARLRMDLRLASESIISHPPFISQVVLIDTQAWAE
jgi:hypothetical protein